MTVASWLLPVLWREHDWRAALVRIGSELAEVSAKPEKLTRAAVDLARATEYIEPDRRKVIAVLELAGPDGDLARARELAVELGWWSARARLTTLACSLRFDPLLVIDEAEAWWDAGQPDLCALALGGLRAGERTEHAAELAALVAERDLAAHGMNAIARAKEVSGAAAADALVMAARFARAAGKTSEVAEHLEAALAADPSHGKAASLLLALARANREPDAVRRFLRARLVGSDPTTSVDRVRACAFALLDNEHQRGFGLRLLRVALERAYKAKLAHVPGHLAMWTLLAAHASADGSRRALLPFVIEAIQVSQQPVDRVWLGALATEISLRDAGHPIVAGAYAEIVAEHAPDHPIVRELVAAVAAPPLPESPPVPPAAVTAAAAHVDGMVGVDVDLGLDETYAKTTADLVGPTKSIPTISSTPSSPSARSPTGRPDDRPDLALASAAPTPAPSKPLPAWAAPQRKTAVIPPIKPTPTSVAPTSVAKPPPPSKPASIVPATIPNSSSIVPASLTKKQTGPMAALAPPPRRSNTPSKPPPSPTPVLQALRTPNRPDVPPPPPDPKDAAPRARRISIPIDIRVIVPNGKQVTGHSRDISTTGLFVLTEGALTVGEEYAIELMLPGAEPFTEQEYRGRARIARKAECGYGIVLLSPDANLLEALAAL